MQSVRLHVVAATNRPESDLRAGRGLRTDLFHRLAGWTITLPPLRTMLKDHEGAFRIFEQVLSDVADELRGELPGVRASGGPSEEIGELDLYAAWLESWSRRVAQQVADATKGPEVCASARSF